MVKVPSLWDFRLILLDKFYLPDRKHRTILLIGGYLYRLACFIDYGDTH